MARSVPKMHHLWAANAKHFMGAGLKASQVGRRDAGAGKRFRVREAKAVFRRAPCA